MKDPNRLCVGIADIGYEISRHSGTVSRMIDDGRLKVQHTKLPGRGNRHWYWTIAQSAWPVQSETWQADVEASQKNGALPIRPGSRPRGRPRSDQSSGSNVLSCVTTFAA
jgi:hypothetical protein